MTVDMFQRLQFVARWHRRIALLVCIWLTALAATGLLINHAHDWGLDRRPLSEPLQRLVYGIEPAAAGFCDSTIGIGIGSGCADVFGRLRLPAGELLLAPDRVYFLDDGARLLEALTPAHVGLNRVTGGAVGADGVYLRDHDRIVRGDFQLLEWHALKGGSGPAPDSGPWLTLPEADDPITWERFLLDLHAARFLGPLAGAFTDFMAVLILLLALSGVWFWWLKRPRD